MKVESLSRRALCAAGLVAFALTGCGGGGSSYQSAPMSQPPETITATMTGDQEVPVRVNSGATGVATFSLTRSTRTLSGTIKVDGVIPTAAHIHLGAAGTAGAVAIPLSIAANYDVTLAATVLTPEQLASLDAGQLYVNIHSSANPNGEIRGQLGREVYVARLNGSQENPAVTSAATGQGYVVLNPATRAISGEVELAGITATAAHIHTGAVGNNGAVLVPLTDHGGHDHFVIPDNTVLSPSDVDALRSGGLYFNAHSAANPNGEVRGQIGRRVLYAFASGMQEVPSTTSSATGKGVFVYDPVTRGLTGNFTVSDVTATAAHLHTGAVGVNGAVSVPLTESTAGSGIWAVPANTVLDATKAQAFLTGGMYANAHSATFTGGEIRGQVGREVYNASLTGAQETAVIATNATGKAFAIVDPETLSLTADLTITGLKATLAHIHTAALGTDGPVTFPLTDAGTGDHFMLANGSITAAQLDSLRSGGMYFNAHSAAHPTGEIRGQAGLWVLAAAAAGSQEVPANTSTASGRALFSMTPFTREIKGTFRLTGIAATAAHIHAAPVGTNGPIVLAFSELQPQSGIFGPAAGAVFTASQAQQLMTGGMYVNAHSATLPAGEIRGQLSLQ
ncbi:CHRD domain-containing protein [Roseateles puraquae]|uniref:CHRD domain-containing protein n=1 Tax=Roseateles puraquae TaxID=431059 RepID=A0A254MZD2_9BURK|nr:CHRD domain-containing protein [Roseateles puraquae]MDG0854327.1 CHRD domain-containing protein [Roseateles puraquae]OWR00734.1 hypothetical protein CDO81_23635 [Roseateles puraquae]